MGKEETNGRKTVQLAIRNEVYQKFKETCNQRALKPNILVEQFMEDVINIDKKVAKDN